MDECTLEHRVVALWVDRALLVMQDLIKLVLRLSCLFATRTAVDSPDDIVWLAFAHRVPLAAAAATIIITLPIVIVAMWKTTAFLFFRVHPMLHHVAQLYH